MSEKNVELRLAKEIFTNGEDFQSKCLKAIIYDLEICGIHCNPWISFDNEKSMCTRDWWQNATEPEKTCGWNAYWKYKENCIYPKQVLIFNPAISTPPPRPDQTLLKNAIEINLSILKFRLEVREEKRITEPHDFIGSLGGSLGMFFGFSIISWIFAGIDKIFELFN